MICKQMAGSAQGLKGVGDNRSLNNNDHATHRPKPYEEFEHLLEAVAESVGYTKDTRASISEVTSMADAKPTAASGTGAPFCWPKSSTLCTPGAETGTGWRSSTTPDKCLQA